MHFSAAIALQSVQFVVFATTAFAQCNHDNCLRAVIASAFPTRSGSADCASYFEATVTPAPVTVSQTSIVSVTYSVPSPPAKKRRDVAPAIMARQVTVTPSSIPAYASACSGSLRYSSACSCVGATHTTTTAATPTSTTTVTSTVTICANPLPTFILQITDSGVVYKGIPLDGTYGNYDDDDGPLVGFNGDPESDAVVLSLTSAGNLEIAYFGVLGNTNGPAGKANLISFGNPPDGLPVICSVVHGTLSCTNNGCFPNTVDGCQENANILQICPSAAITNDLWIGAEIGEDCDSATFNVIPVCLY